MYRSVVSTLTLSLLLLTSVPAQARVITVDGVGDDWDDAGWAMDAPLQEDVGHVARNPAEEGEYIWTDRASDQRTDLGAASHVDLVEVRITGDATYIYFAARMADIGADQVSGAGAPLLQIAVDTDRVAGNGELWLGGFSETQVAEEARWERLITTTFGSIDPVDTSHAESGLRMYTADATGSSWSADYPATSWSAIDAAADMIEGRISWIDLGFTGPPAEPLRLTFAAFQSNAADDAEDVYGSDCLDVVTNYGDPGSSVASSLNTWTEVSDGALDYHWDVYFESLDKSDDGDVYPPLLISEVVYDSTGPEPGSELIELYNATPGAVGMTGYKVGDAQAIDSGSEGMEMLGCGELPADARAVVANDASDFFSLHGFPPDFAMSPSTLPVAQTTPYAEWASGSVQLSNSGDQVLLLDPFDTVVDVVEYESGSISWSAIGGTSISAPAGSSIQRTIAIPNHLDRNDMANEDFSVVGGEGEPVVGPADCGCGNTGDGDGDSTPDCDDPCFQDPAKVLPGACGCGTPDVDTDGDNVMDCNDPCPNDNPDDTDGDGVCESNDVCPGGDDTVDGDSDGVPDDCDNCPAAANPGQADNDGDGLGDVCDDDDDDDGVPDTTEVDENMDPLDPDSDGDTISDGAEVVDPSLPVDTDSDGVIDALDDDSDGDSIPDSEEAGDTDLATPPIDTDQDGTPDFQDLDSDGDGVDDDTDNCRLVPNAAQEDSDNDGVGDACQEDADGDGVPNEEDNCPSTANPDQLDTDGDGDGDVCDGDDDGDGVTDEQDICPLDPDPDQTDTDGDGAGDACDGDDDGDGIGDQDDNCPVDENPNQLDTDGDGQGNFCDGDDDDDGVPDDEDNCPIVENPDQADADGDGIGDACDGPLDTDGDGVADEEDNCPDTPNPGQEDTDGDGTGDACEEVEDTDGDGVADDVDNCPATVNPGQDDEDEDGVGDACDEHASGGSGGSGCGCRQSGARSSSTPAPAPLLLFGLLLLAIGLRRRLRPEA
jgi:hypothetical protein